MLRANEASSKSIRNHDQHADAANAPEGDAKKLDRREIETIKRERLREIAKQIKAHEQEEAIIKGRSGKGHKGGK